MKAFAVMILMLIAPFFLYYGTEQKQLAGFVGLFVAFSVPSMIEITIYSIKNKCWPKIVGGPSVRFGKYRIGK